MLDRQHGKIIFECDTCADTLDTGTTDFNEARETMRQDGWHARKFGEDWIHACPDCGERS